MKILRTPDSQFNDLKDYPYKAVYTNITTQDGTELRIHHIDEGPRDGPILLAMHGQPVWSYLYAKMIPFLTAAGIRVIAPDLPGYGKSDKPAAREDYSYQNQVDWMVEWLEKNDFRNLTFFGQDWGGLIGLRLVAARPEHFIKVSIGNTGLPYNPDVPQDVIDKVGAFRNNKKIKLTPLSMGKEISKMDNREDHPALKFMYWQKFCWETANLPTGFISSMMIEKLPPYKKAINYLFYKLRITNSSPFYTELSKAFDAPFPDASFKMGTRAMPSHVPIIPDASLEAQKKARAFFKDYDKPFLSIFAGNDPVTNGLENDVLKMAPNAISADHIGGGHFYQWTKPKELSQTLINFIKE
jgi:haloalkane dehalogenase